VASLMRASILTLPLALSVIFETRPLPTMLLR